MMRRVHITGGPGAGKTRMSRILGRRLGLDVFELDGQARELVPKMGPLIDFDALAAMRLAETARLAAGEIWLTEGTNTLVAQPLLERAEIIVVLETTWRVAAYRILARHLKASIARNNRYPSLRALWKFWFWSRRYYKNSNPPGMNEWGTPTTRESLEQELAAYESKIVRCHSDRDIEAVLARLEQPASGRIHE